MTTTRERWSALMIRALELAEQGRYGTSPNPMVGAVVLDSSGNVVGEGAHRRCGGEHAEVAALTVAGPRAVGGTLVVTLEPCAHHGRTAPCVDAVLAAGIRRVVIGTLDPNPLVNGAGAAKLRAAGVEVVEGIEADRCAELNYKFFHFMRHSVPYVTLKMAMTLDGKLAARGGRSRWITSEAARREGYALREEFDAVLVGVGTVLADDPRLTRHLGLNPNPALLRVVLDSHLRVSPTAMLLENRPEDVVVFCLDEAPAAARAALEGAGARVVSVGDDGQGRCDLRQVLRWLGGAGVSSLLVEGGGEVHWSFLKEGLAQRLHVFLAPLVLGGREATPAVGGAGFASPQEGVRLAVREVRRVAEDIVIVAEVGGV
ncbi:MAG: bifunctional diaminohydroxyphosphoribosylaminopyrimidine deaminase/5-amino-6-(5-phosphoribosylamino)uracil reductase RibD [Thermoanaerobaculaceae bacterium]|nr:bifunctional diaminohydroxyphosphoribosylaminopyrimidine deaminase/5-amino-6-(5-phosphoribosylamino)uracil reductase RibD [Thermoanaerobaculaceae bacterium]